MSVRILKVYKLDRAQIVRLTSQGNKASDWENVRFVRNEAQHYIEEKRADDTANETQHRLLAYQEIVRHALACDCIDCFDSVDLIAIDDTLSVIWGCAFDGVSFIELIDMGVEDHVRTRHNVISSGLYNSSFSSDKSKCCYLSQGCYIQSCGLVHNVFVGRNAKFLNCGVIAGNNLELDAGSIRIAVGPESNIAGKSRWIQASIATTYLECCSQAFRRSTQSQDASFTLQGMTFIGDFVRLLQCGSVRDCFLASYTTVSESSLNRCISMCGAVPSTSDFLKIDSFYGTEASNITTVSHAVMCDVLMHWPIAVRGDCDGAKGCSISAVVMFANSRVGGGAAVRHCVLAPSSCMFQGECLHSILGPGVGFHHPALLISTSWILGGGNIAAGSLIGANHSGRIADQECIVGEGIFFGLAAKVRFPCCLLESPYSIIAAGTELVPQRIGFPFSLVCDGKPHAILKPGWMIYGNSYYLER
jgi:hypothetical protein